MKPNFGWLIFTGACGLALCAPVESLGQMTPFYGRADIGGTWSADTGVKEFFGQDTTGVKVKFDPGVRFDFAGGYRLTDWFAAEAELGVLDSPIDSIRSGSVHDASLLNVPLLLNARFQWPTRSRFTPFLGGGLGVSAAVIDADRIDLFSDGTQTTMHGTQSDAVFAYQAFAGIRYRLNAQMGVSVQYQYFATTDPTWRADFFVGPGSDRMRFGGMETHAVTVAFDYQF